jgi:lipopolysaccharide export system protein LptA
MPISIPRLRTWFAIIAIATVLTVLGFYSYARYRVHRALKDIPEKLGIEIQQSTDNFSLSKSEGGHTLFTIKASKAIQYKQGGHAQLKDVSIIVFGKHSERFDQIYGSSFEYDPEAGTVSANGDVMIDLQANGDAAKHPDQATPKELKNPVHLKTSGLVFNQKTGIAHTDKALEFRVPQASGSAVGATYDSKANRLTLDSEVIMQTAGDRGSTIHARSAVVTRDPQQISLQSVSVAQQGANFDANNVDVLVRSDNTIEKVIATGDVRLRRAAENGFAISSPRAELSMGAKNMVNAAQFTGGVKFDGTGKNTANGTAGRINLDFGPQNRVKVVHALDNVHFTQMPGVGKSQNGGELTAPALDLYTRGGRAVDHAETIGTSKLVLEQSATAHPGEHTTVVADHFRADFGKDNKLASLRGDRNTHIVFTVPGEPDRVSNSDELTVQLAPGGGIASLAQRGHFDFEQAASGKSPAQHATADRAVYTPDNDSLALSGTPRIVDGGMTITAQQVRVNRRTGDAFAQGDVKTTYSELKPQPSGALLATSDPIHVTSKNMNAQRQSGIARYTGGSRLWQGANIVEASTIEFDRTQRSLTAQGPSNGAQAAQPVSSVFVQADKSGKTTPVVVTAAKLTYLDSDRKARYSGGVIARGQDATISADQVDIVLMPANAVKNSQAGAPAQLQQIVAGAHVVIQQSDRRATGEKLVYTPQDGRFVLTGGPPLITDPERGFIRGDSLTFYSRDDRVIVESEGAQRTVTHTRVNQ